MNSQSLVGMPASTFARRLPSFLRGAVVQSLSTLATPAEYAHTGGPAVLLIPGLFCTPSVYNRLGRQLERLGFDVHLPRRFAFYHGVLANTDRLTFTVAALLTDLEALARQGLARVTLVGHSLGGIIALATILAAQDEQRSVPDISGPILLATPLHGAPIASALTALVPACRDLFPGATALRNLQERLPAIGRIVIADEDSLTPPAAGEAASAVVRLSGFQHMDFYAGSDEQVARAARVIADAVRETRAADGRRKVE